MVLDDGTQWSQPPRVRRADGETGDAPFSLFSPVLDGLPLDFEVEVIFRPLLTNALIARSTGRQDLPGRLLRSFNDNLGQW